MGLRYGLLAALTLVLACALLWDRLHPPTTRSLFPRDLPAVQDTARIIVGGTPAPSPPIPTAPSGPGVVESTADVPASDAVETGGDREYTVAAGDTLGRIATTTLGTSRKASELAAANGMKVTDPLRIGQVLRIPAPVRIPTPVAPASGSPAPATARSVPAAAEKTSERTHQVAGGETLFSLAKRYYGDGSRWQRIASANGLAEDDTLKVGLTLRIP